MPCYVCRELLILLVHILIQADYGFPSRKLMASFLSTEPLCYMTIERQFKPPFNAIEIVVFTEEPVIDSSP